MLQCAAVSYSSLLRCVGNSCLPLVGFDALVARLKGQYQLRFMCVAVCCRVSQRVAVCQFDALVGRHKDQYQLRSTILFTIREVGGWGRDPFSRNFMKPTPRRKWYLTTGRRFH